MKVFLEKAHPFLKILKKPWAFVLYGPDPSLPLLWEQLLSPGLRVRHHAFKDYMDCYGNPHETQPLLFEEETVGTLWCLYQVPPDIDSSLKKKIFTQEWLHALHKEKAFC